jgi:hypothetical protein
MGKLFDKMTPGFFLGILLVALGAAGVFAFKPVSATAVAKASGDSNLVLIVIGISLTVLCWGAYGSLLHKSQHHMENSRLRPLLCVGIAYFAIAVIIPILIMSVSESGFPKEPTFVGWSFSMLAGVFGAVGAFGIILSFTFGGKPVFVMPLVFGGAPIINTIISVLEMEAVGEVSSMFYGSLTTVIIGAIVTLVTAPKPDKLERQAAVDDSAEVNDSAEVDAAE